MEKKWKTILVLLFGIIICSIILGCGINKEQLQGQVKTMLQEKLNSDDQFSKYKLEVNEVLLISSGKNSYDGMAKVILDNKEYDVPLTVSVDGQNIIFQTKPMAFAFLAQYELNKLGF